MAIRQDNVLTKKASPQTQYAILQPLKKGSFFIYLRHIVTLVLKYINRDRLFFPALLANIFSYTKKHKLLFGHITKKAYLCTR